MTPAEIVSKVLTFAVLTVVASLALVVMARTCRPTPPENCRSRHETRWRRRSP